VKAKLNIAVNCWILRNKAVDGIGIFTIETFRQMISDHPEIDFMLLCDKNFTEDYFDFPNTKKYFIFPPYRHPLLYVFYMEVVLGLFLRRHRPDIFVGVDGFLCLSSKTRQLPVIHDLNFEHSPKDLPFRNRVYYRTFFKRFARKATRIATVSEYSKKDIVQLYGIDPGKIDVISLGIKTIFSPLAMDQQEKVRQRFTGGENYFLFVGSMHPRKNILRLMAAFELFKASTGSSFKLMLAGNILWDDTDIKAQLEKMLHKDAVVFTGRLTDADLQDVMGSAFCLSFVPLFEGFGLPIVEAFQAGIPVICSNITSMPEVAADAALLVDPYDVEEIAAAMKKITTEDTLRVGLVAKGKERAGMFTWKKTAGLLFESILKTIG